MAQPADLLTSGLKMYCIIIMSDDNYQIPTFVAVVMYLRIPTRTNPRTNPCMVTTSLNPRPIKNMSWCPLHGICATITQNLGNPYYDRKILVNYTVN